MSAGLLIFLLAVSPLVGTGRILIAPIEGPPEFAVRLLVDFGPAAKAPVDREVRVPRGATPKEALESVLSVESGAICCHAQEVKGIGGVRADPLKNRWWRCEVNGEGRSVSPHKTRLQAGDLLKWTYFEARQ